MWAATDIQQTILGGGRAVCVRRAQFPGTLTLHFMNIKLRNFGCDVF